MDSTCSEEYMHNCATACYMCVSTLDISFIYRSLKVLEFGLILYEILAKKGLIAAQTFGYKGLISV